MKAYVGCGTLLNYLMSNFCIFRCITYVEIQLLQLKEFAEAIRRLCVQFCGCYLEQCFEI